jgi:hypothetical protein
VRWALDIIGIVAAVGAGYLARGSADPSISRGFVSR